MVRCSRSLCHVLHIRVMVCLRVLDVQLPEYRFDLIVCQNIVSTFCSIPFGHIFALSPLKNCSLIRDHRSVGKLGDWTQYAIPRTISVACEICVHNNILLLVCRLLVYRVKGHALDAMYGVDSVSTLLLFTSLSDQHSFAEDKTSGGSLMEVFLGMQCPEYFFLNCCFESVMYGKVRSFPLICTVWLTADCEFPLFMKTCKRYAHAAKHLCRRQLATANRHVCVFESGARLLLMVAAAHPPDCSSGHGSLHPHCLCLFVSLISHNAFFFDEYFLFF